MRLPRAARRWAHCEGNPCAVDSSGVPPMHFERCGGCAWCDTNTAKEVREVVRSRLYLAPAARVRVRETTQERNSERSGEGTVGVSVPNVVEDILEVIMELHQDAFPSAQGRRPLMCACRANMRIPTRISSAQGGRSSMCSASRRERQS